MRQYPDWLKQRFSPNGVARDVRSLLEDLALVTVCESARCPNLHECYSQRQLTFMILGGRCTRSCRFCAVEHGRPQPVASDEPWRLAQAVRRLGLEHVVITSVARDDLPDEGAGHFVEVIRAVRAHNPGVSIEVLTPDFHGREELVTRLLDQGRPEVFAHNIETIERLSRMLRPQASYARSLGVLRMAASRGSGCLIKSSLMVGVGETWDELRQAFRDLLEAGVTHVTVGQYLRPTPAQLPVMEYVSPERFGAYERLAYALGFLWVKAGPFVRSSYHAVDALRSHSAGRNGSDGASDNELASRR